MGLGQLMRSPAAAECAIRVPQSLMLHSGLATADATYGAAFRALLAEAGSELADRFVLCLVLLMERLKGGDSAWAPYINMLPTTYGGRSGLRAQVFGLADRFFCSKRMVGAQGFDLRFQGSGTAFLYCMSGAMGSGPWEPCMNMRPEVCAQGSGLWYQGSEFRIVLGLAGRFVMCLVELLKRVQQHRSRTSSSFLLNYELDVKTLCDAQGPWLGKAFMSLFA